MLISLSGISMTCRDEATVILEENKKDESVDDDCDGIPDVDQMDPKELMMHKAHIIMTKCNPEKINTALGGAVAVFTAAAAARVHLRVFCRAGWNEGVELTKGLTHFHF